MSQEQRLRIATLLAELLADQYGMQVASVEVEETNEEDI